MAKRAKQPEGLRLRGGVYYGRWVERGKKVERRLSADLRVAVAMLAEIRKRMELATVGIDRPGGLDELGEALAVYLDGVRRRCVASHAQDVATGIRRVLDILGGTKRLSDITSRDLTRAQDEIADSGVSHRTAVKVVGYVIAWLRWCERSGRIRQAPRAPERLPTTGRHATHERRRLLREECRALQAAADADGPIGDLVAVLLGTGMRLQEATGLVWADWTAEGLRVGASRTKTGRGRTVAIPPELAERLEQMRQGRGDDALICPAPMGGRWTTSRSSHTFRRVLRAAGMEQRDREGRVIDMHALRHTYATELAASGASLPVLMAQLGWSSPRMAQVYIDATRLGEAQQAAAMALQHARDGGQVVGKRSPPTT